MTTDTVRNVAPQVAAPQVEMPTSSLPLAIKLAVREFRGGLNGFYVFISCIALGVAVITAVGVLADALRTSFDRQGETLLGGDITVTRPHKRADDKERAWLAGQGRMSETGTLRAMGRRADGEEQALVEVKGIDGTYPLVGEIKLSGGVTLASLLPTDGTDGGVAVEPIILERLRVKVGDTIALGKSSFQIRALIEAEPDKISERMAVGPRVLVATSALEATGLIDPGSLVAWRYALKLNDPLTRETPGLVKFRDTIQQALPEGGFTIRDRRDPSPQVTKTLERLRQFLTLLGLTALMVGGVGVANAVATYIDRRRGIIATFKSLGATSSVIFGMHLAQVLMIATIGVIIGLCVGVAIPFGIAALFGEQLPIKADVTIRPASLLIAAGYGLLISLLFTLWPLGRAELVRAAVLFRDEVAPEDVRPKPLILAAIAATGIVLFALAVLGAESKSLAAWYCLAVAGALALFFGLGSLITWLARKLPRQRRPEFALAIGNIAAPGGLTRSVVLSLGAGLTLLVAVALVDRSIVAELSDRVPETSPNYFVLDIKKSELPEFEALVRRESPKAEIHTAPMLRGRIVKIGETPAEQVKLKPEQQWVLNGDRGLSYAQTVPEGSKVVDGSWWAADYTGDPLVSFERELAKGLNLKVGDSVTVNVLGRNVTARIANLREVKWESLALNFVMVFTPNTLRAAPHNVLATITLPKDAAVAAEAQLARIIGKAYPAVTAIRVKDAINQFSAIFQRIMTAVRVASSITLLAGALVLAGALATAQRRRIKQAVILKTLGATRRRILTSHLMEYAILAAATAACAVVIGGLAAWVTVSRVMKLQFVMDPVAVLQALGLALALVCVFGGLGTWRVLQARPVPHLRSA
jgi:putative ABC transport system permease protein